MKICVNYVQRRQRFYDRLLENEVEAYYTSYLSNLYYLTGFQGTTGILIAVENRIFLLLDGRYKNYGSEIEADDLEVLLIKNNNKITVINDILQKYSAENIALEKKRLGYSEFCALKNKLNVTKRFYGKDLVEELRMVKDNKEIEFISEAAKRTLELFSEFDQMVKPGVRECELNRFLRSELEKRGETRAFYPLVLSGPRSACPHAPPSHRKLEPGDSLLVDIGLKYRGYCSDITRMFFCGNEDTLGRKLYRLSAQAAHAAFLKLQVGVALSEPALAARKVIEAAGYESGLRHGLGHGVGIDIHEKPSLRREATGELRAGMVVTVEPGIYVDARAGGRIEHMVLLTEDGPRLIDEPDTNIEEELEFYGITK